MSEPWQPKQELLLLGEAFREVREWRGLGVGELAGAAGVDRACIEALEAGRLDADYELLLTLADGIGVRPSAFFGRAEELGAAARAGPLDRASKASANAHEM